MATSRAPCTHPGRMQIQDLAIRHGYSAAAALHAHDCAGHVRISIVGQRAADFITGRERFALVEICRH